MRPKPVDERADHDLFRTALVDLIDHRHELIKLAELIDWQTFAIEWVLPTLQRRALLPP